MRQQAYRVKVNDKGEKKRDLIIHQNPIEGDKCIEQQGRNCKAGFLSSSIAEVGENAATTAAANRGGISMVSGQEGMTCHLWSARAPVPLRPQRKSRNHGFARILKSIATGRERVLNVQRGAPLSGYVHPVDALSSLIAANAAADADDGRDDSFRGGRGRRLEPERPETDGRGEEYDEDDEDTVAKQAIALFAAFGLSLGKSEEQLAKSGDNRTNNKSSSDQGSKSGSRPGSATSARSGGSTESAMSGSSSVSFVSATSGMTASSMRSRNSKSGRRKKKKSEIASIRSPGVSDDDVPKYDIEAQSKEFEAQLDEVVSNLDKHPQSNQPTGNNSRALSSNNNGAGTSSLGGGGVEGLAFTEQRPASTHQDESGIGARRQRHASVLSAHPSQGASSSQSANKATAGQVAAAAAGHDKKKNEVQAADEPPSRTRNPKPGRTRVEAKAATNTLSRTLREVKSSAAKIDRKLAAALRTRERDWHQQLPLKFETLLPGAHSSLGRLISLPSEVAPRRRRFPVISVQKDDDENGLAGLAELEKAAKGGAESENGVESDEIERSLGSQMIDDMIGGEVQYRDVLVEVRAMGVRMLARQRGKLSESVRLYGWLRPMLQKLISSAQKRGGLPQCVLKFLAANYRMLASGAVLDESVMFIIMRYAFKGKDWKEKTLEYIVPVVCEALHVPHEQLQIWFRENNIDYSQNLLRILKKRTGRGRHKGGGGGSRHNKHHHKFGGAAASKRSFGGLGSLDEGGASMPNGPASPSTSSVGAGLRSSPGGMRGGAVSTPMRTSLGGLSMLEDDEEEDETRSLASEASRA